MDSEAFVRLKEGSEKEIGTLYQAYRAAFVRFIAQSFPGSPGRGEELYPEAFGIVYFNIRNGKLTAPLRSTLQTYLNSTGWHLYHRRYLDKYHREKLALDQAEHEIDTTALVDEALLQKERASFLRTFLHQLGDPCKTLLMEIYFHETNYKDLSMKLNTPEATLRKRKFDCLEKLRRIIHERQPDL